MPRYFPSAFGFFEGLAEYTRCGPGWRTPARLEMYDILRDFLSSRLPADGKLIDELLIFDMYMMDNIKLTPEWRAGILDERDAAAIRALLKERGDTAGRRFHAEKFNFNIGQWFSGEASDIKREDNYCLFKYPRKTGEGTEYEILD